MIVVLVFEGAIRRTDSERATTFVSLIGVRIALRQVRLGEEDVGLVQSEGVGKLAVGCVPGQGPEVGMFRDEPCWLIGNAERQIL